MNADFVVHLASSILPQASNHDPIYDINANLLGGLNVLNACVRNSVERLIFISSGGTVYGNPIESPISESHPTNPHVHMVSSN